MTTSALEDPPDSFANAGLGAPAAGPFAESLAFGRDAERQGETGGVILALALHAFVAMLSLTSFVDLNGFAVLVQEATQARFDTMIDIAIDEPEPEPEVEPEPEPPPPPPEAQEPEPTTEPVPIEEAAPAAAESGEVLTAPAEEPLDLLDQGIISGPGTRFSGGVSAADGTSTKAVRKATATGQGIEGGRGSLPATPPPPPVDKSQPAGLVPGDDWTSCPFPAEADAEQQHQAMVRLVIVVGPDGRPSSVNVLSDPGYGFGQAARQCALRKRYTPGRDAAGQPVTKATPPLRVRFHR